MTHLPFSVFKRAGRQFYYVQFKNSKGEYLPGISTRQMDKALAIETSFKWFRDGRPSKNGSTVIHLNIQEVLRNVKTIQEATFICNELKQRGFLKSYVVSESQQATDFITFLQDFWNYESSPYVKERLRREHGIHQNYVKSQGLDVIKYWKPFFKNRLIGDITRNDIEQFIDAIGTLAGRELSGARKNSILRSGVIPLRWAFSKELIEKDVTAHITWFSNKFRERHILTPEIVQILFAVEWLDERSRLANMLSSVTGLRAGEVQGLRIQDLGNDCLYIRHSWNVRDKLKTTKNNEERKVEVPFPYLMNSLAQLAKSNPHGVSMDSYVFWAEKSATKPMENCLFIEGLRDALIKIGMKQESASLYVFHGWRHFFTTYMIGHLDTKLLKYQTGHKTDSMLIRYGNHQTEEDRGKIRQAQVEVFGRFIPKQLKQITS